MRACSCHVNQTTKAAAMNITMTRFSRYLGVAYAFYLKTSCYVIIIKTTTTTTKPNIHLNPDLFETTFSSL